VEQNFTDAREDNLVRFRESNCQLVRADRFEIHGGHLVFLRADGELSAVFLFEIVRGWMEVNPSSEVRWLGTTPVQRELQIEN
jgi:hypothetical protein